MENKSQADVNEPIDKSSESPERKLGILESKSSFTIKEGFKITDEELLSL